MSNPPAVKTLTGWQLSLGGSFRSLLHTKAIQLSTRDPVNPPHIAPPTLKAAHKAASAEARPSAGLEARQTGAVAALRRQLIAARKPSSRRHWPAVKLCFRRESASQKTVLSARGLASFQI